MKTTIGKLKKLIQEALKPDISSGQHTVPLSIDQVMQFFPEAWASALELYKDNVEAAKETGDWDPQEPGLLSPDQCRWSLQAFGDFDSPYYENALSDFPGYVLHFYDDEAVANLAGGGSDMKWTGDEWEM